jgi:hypothetical protein
MDGLSSVGEAIVSKWSANATFRHPMAEEGA